MVEENNLQVQISSLRRVLGPRAIATIPGRGYRLAMRGTGHDGADHPGAAPTAKAPPPAAPALRERRNSKLPEVLPPLFGRDAELVRL